jgi:hypothetical protein
MPWTHRPAHGPTRPEQWERFLADESCELRIVRGVNGDQSRWLIVLMGRVVGECGDVAPDAMKAIAESEAGIWLGRQRGAL